jgi:plasmid stabilization system protein ParE
MTGYSFHPDALTDLDEIWNYIAGDNPAAARGRFPGSWQRSKG